MTFKDTGFRMFYHNFCAIALDDKTKPALEGFPNPDEGSYALVYGYIEPEAGMRLEVIAACKKAKKYCYFADSNPEIHSFIEMEAAQDADAIYFEDADNNLHTRYADKLEVLKAYDASEAVEESRTFNFLDHLRHPFYPDDVRVLLVKKGLKVEECWVRITGLGDHELIGQLLNEPNQDFPCHQGDEITFVLEKTKEDEFVCVSSFDEQSQDAEVNIAAQDSNFRSNDKYGIGFSVKPYGVFNFALYQNHIRPVRGIRIQNISGNPIEGLTLRITSDFHFFKKYEQPLPPIPSGKPISLADPHLIINGNMLAEMTEEISTIVTVEICKDGEMIVGYRNPMRVLAYDQSPGPDYFNFLPAFVMPNHPAIPALMNETARILNKWGKHAALEGYQGKDPNRVRVLAAAAYAAIQKQNIVYANPPASFSAGQRIRTPEIVLEQHLGTCMDMSLLYASLLEAIGLHPVLYLIQGHIFTGVWLFEKCFEDPLLTNNSEILKRMAKGSEELSFVECTAMCAAQSVDFEKAEKHPGHSQLSEDVFTCAVDVIRSRMAGILPMSSRSMNSGSFQVAFEERNDDDLTAAPQEIEISIPEAAQGPKKILTKQALWESKLLDLTRHNMLLSLPTGKNIEPIMSTNLAELEDALADGEEFHVQPIPDWITNLGREVEENGKKYFMPWIVEEVNEKGFYEITNWQVGPYDLGEKLRQEYRSHRLYTFFSQKELDKQLTAIYRAAKASQQENGVSSLYLALGMLRWFEDQESDVPCYAPLILLPIEIVRKSANQGYALHMRDEEPHFNTTLLEMLRQLYNLDIRGLEPLPSDEHGVDIRKSFATVRKAIFSIPRWDVVESCAIGNFSFAQFAMWNDLHTAGEMLENSKLVRSLIKGHIDWDLQAPDNEDAGNLYLPITVDGTQLAAIRMAAAGNTFVLHGPPGTGKSQTITAMIANLMANKKKVLFVAEKMAALTVVQKRLAALGIGNFCLELHSDKANKKQVLTQLEQALKSRFKYHETPYKAKQQKTVEERALLDQYSEHLYRIYPCGFSLRELIDRYEAVEDAASDISFTSEEAALLSAEMIEEHMPQLKKLLAAGSAAEGLTKGYYSRIGITDYSFIVRHEIPAAADRVWKATDTLCKTGSELASSLSSETPETRKEFLQLTIKAKDLLQAKAGFETAVQTLQKKCRPALFEADVEGILARHASAEKKFFGKSSAMAAVVSEVQNYFTVTVTFDEIPELLKLADTYQQEKARLPYASDSSVYTQAESFLSAYETFCGVEEELNALLKRQSEEDDVISDIPAFCDFLKSHSSELKDRALYNHIRETCIRIGLTPVVAAYEADPARKDIPAAYQKGLYFALISNILREDDFISSFSGTTFNEAIRQYKLADDELMELAKQEIYDLLAANIPSVAESPKISNQLMLLRKAITSNARGLSIRELFDRIPDILYRLTPCMLMSPNSVAQYLEQKNDLFDVVIFDEASQLPTCKAVGALARARNAVIVGDPKQMPPTSFFAGSGSIVEDLALDDLDSILDDALALGIPSQHLRWHYRSKHESLIAFSNHQFYENKMFTFPSANDREQHVTAVHVDGIYKNSVNGMEAEAVVSDIYRRYCDPQLNGQSVGVVTFNVKQQDLIYNLLAKQFQADPAFDQWANSGEDPLFIKNLENVQGDERDVILFSIGYGRNEKDSISMNFGPINKPGGGKRLNVAFSRARISMVIFTSLYSTDIKVTPSSPDGLIAFRDFLKFAEGNAIAEDRKLSESENKEGGILESIRRRLQENGYICDVGIGHSDFQIDLAVVNPYEPEKYLLGVLLDGETYRNTKNTRDREIAQIGVLRGLGWNICRIWTIDWMENKTKEINRLLTLAAELKEAARKAFEASQAKEEETAAEQEARKQQEAKMQAALHQQAAEALSEEEEADDIPEQDAAQTAEQNEPAAGIPPESESPSEEDLPQEMAPPQPQEASVKPVGEDDRQKSPTSEPISDRPAEAETDYHLCEYITAQVPSVTMSTADFTAGRNRGEIRKVAELILNTEAPILKDTLVKRILSSFGVSKNASSLEAVEKALKSAGVKNSKYKGIVFCWAPDQEPKDYTAIRVSNERSGDEICPQEIKNAACYALRQNSPMDKDDLVKAISVLFGYKRLGKNLEAAITNALPYAKSNGYISNASGKYTLS